MIRRVHLLHLDVSTRSATRAVREPIRIIRVILRDTVGFLYLTRNVGEPQSHVHMNRTSVASRALN
eukprot:7779159-Pyramimonas_sp.AAC.1